MVFDRRLHWATTALLVFVRVGQALAQNVTTDLEATYLSLQKEGSTLYRLDPDASTVRIYAFRGGKAARMGHNHVLSAPRFEGFFLADNVNVNESRFDLIFRLDQLVVDNPQERAALGGSFSAALSDDAVLSTRNNMLGDKNFEAKEFPWVRVQSVQIVGEHPKFAVRMAVGLHGQTHESWIPLTVTVEADVLRAQGAWVLRQSDFGVKPFSVLGGLLAVQNEVLIEFALNGTPVPAPTPGTNDNSREP